MRLISKLHFMLSARVRHGSKISLGVYLKGVDKISIGRSCKIHSAASLEASREGRIVLGDRVTINRYAYLQADSGGIECGNGVEINNFSIINGTGGVVIGDDTLIGPGVRIISYQHEIESGRLIRLQPVRKSPIVIGKDVWIGANAVILAGVSIGDGSVVGAGAVVTRDVASNVVVAGVPARVAKNR